MKTNPFYLFAGAAIVLLSLIGNYVFFAAKELKAPIFLKHYHGLSDSLGTTIELHYITNRNNDQETDIAWGHIPGTDLLLPPAFQFTAGTYKHYLHKTVGLELTEEFLEEMKEESMELKQISVTFTNGDTSLVDVGNISLYKRSDAPFDYPSSGSSSDNSGFQLLKAEKDMELTGLDIPYEHDLQSALIFEVIHDQVKLQKYENRPEGIFNEKGLSLDEFPFSLMKGDSLSIKYEFSFEEGNPLRFNFYELHARLRGNVKGGQEFTDTIYLSYRPYFTEKELNAFVQEERK